MAGMNIEIQKWARIALIMFVIFMGVTIVSGLQKLRAVDPAYNSITVTGQGEATAVPDVATFTFSVSADADTVAAAQSAVTDKMDKVLQALKDLGIDDKDVKTTDYSVYPKYVYNTIYCITVPCLPQQKQDGYTANHSVMVKVRKTDDAGKALAAAGDAGATNLSGLSFQVDDADQVTAEARAEAIDDAKAKAKALAKELGVRLVRIVSYSDSTSGGPVPYYALDSRAGGLEAQAKAPTLPMGENKSSVTVNVTYEIR
jgi:uncharacterized protein YggE